ncbi:MAG: aminotransferase class IV [Aquificaceae bacterium]|nr:aminotransferase class IV [Aquificaceae bacterium]MCX8164617.1 aminotransferase class IV [Aquificaceae bacterium]
MLNRTLLFGEGLFETIRWKPSEEKLKLHHERLSNSAKSLGIPCPSYEEFQKELEEAVPREGQLYVKYLLISKGGWHLTDEPESYGSLILVRNLGHQPSMVSLCVSSYQRHSSDPLCRHKTTSYLFNLMVKKEATKRGFWDGVVLNEKGQACETSTSNLLLLKGSRLYTPAKVSGLLWGTTLELLGRRREVKEEYIKVQELENYDGVFVLNSLLLCAVVNTLEGVPLKRDMQAFKELGDILRACLCFPREEGPQGM